ncbi:hypothetical protein U9L70_00085 [Staphylococcus equorum]|uniref:hypothetical protein n=1 Tax=Staphylococcus equorum TaxID=246432 RepID=UPI00397F322D
MDEKQLIALVQDIDNHLSDDMFSKENVSERMSNFLNEEGNMDFSNAISYSISESRTYSQNLIVGILLRSGLVDKMEFDMKD